MKIFEFSSLIKVIDESDGLFIVVMGSKTITTGSEEYCHHIASLLYAGFKALTADDA